MLSLSGPDRHIKSAGPFVVHKDAYGFVLKISAGADSNPALSSRERDLN